MKKNIAKNQYGYHQSQTRLELLKTLLMFVAALGVLAIGYFTTGSKNNLLTMVAVLGLLPAAKSLVNYIMFVRAKTAVCPKNLHDSLMEITKEQKNAPFLRYDLYMTNSESCFPIYAIACKGKCLIGYSDQKKYDWEKAEQHIKAMAKQNGYEVSVVKIFTEEKKFLERVKAMTQDGQDICETDKLLTRLMENLTL